ncbi:Methyl farnesoate epoxidase, partial [Armadillidium nasatum]
VTGSVAVAIPFLRYIFPESTGYASVKRGSKGVQEFTKMVIADHKKDFDPEKPRDFIDIYLNELNNNKGIDASFTTRIHKELDEVVGRDRYPTVRDRPSLVYTDATLMEVLRMRGPLPIMIPHRVTKDATVCGFNLPSDTLLLINVFSVQMDKKYWGDPEHFRPERFITPENKIRKEERLIPFGKG